MADSGQSPLAVRGWRHLLADNDPTLLSEESKKKILDWLEKRWRDIEVVIHMAAISSTTEPDADKIVHSNFTLSRDLFR